MRKAALRFLTKAVLAGLLLLPFSVPAKAHGRFRGEGRAIIVPHYSYFYPYWGPAWGWGWGGPFWDYTPYYHSNTGQVKIKDHDKSDEVYINGSFAGTVARMKTIELSPGTYTIQVKRDGKELVNRSIYVIAGKTVDIRLEGG